MKREHVRDMRRLRAVLRRSAVPMPTSALCDAVRVRWKDSLLFPDAAVPLLHALARNGRIRCLGKMRRERQPVETCAACGRPFPLHGGGHTAWFWQRLQSQDA